MTGGAEGCEGRRTKEWERVDVPRALWRFERRGCGGCEWRDGPARCSRPRMSGSLRLNRTGFEQ